MQDRELYRRILGIESPWYVERVDLKLAEGEVHVYLEHQEVRHWACPECGAEAQPYDHQGERGWRHLDTCQYQTILHTRPPRAECPEHGVRVVKLPWAEPSSRFTALFEALAIEWLKEASQKAVGEQLGLSWDEVHGLMERAVKRGLERREAESVTKLGVDEKAFRKGQSYFTLVNDLVKARVLYVAEGRQQASLDGFWETLTEEQKQNIEAVAMDMWDPYVASVREHLPGAEKKIVFDKFHIAKHLGEAVDRVRRGEQKTLKAAGDDRLTGTRYDWLRHPARMEPKDRRDFAQLRNSGLKTARAWALKETAMALFCYVYERPARKHLLVAQLGGTQPAATHDRGGKNAEAPFREHHHLSAPSSDQRRQRVHQRQDSMGEVHGTRIFGITELCQRHLLSLWRLDLAPDATK